MNVPDYPRIEKDRITVCICTFRRPELLTRLLASLARQRTDGLFSFSCAVVDNDPSASARTTIGAVRPTFPVPIRYAHEPQRNIALARNCALTLVDGELLAFIDDDEVAGEEWLLSLWRALHYYGADAVLGPVLPYFENKPPEWIIRSGICDRPSHVTGSTLHWRESRTGNVLLQSSLVSEEGIRFNPEYGTGGEDVDFFRRCVRAGRRLSWCEEAPVYELVPEQRLCLRYFLKRALLQGQISLKYAMDQRSALGTCSVAAKALAAIFIYTCSLPFLFLIGEQAGLKYLVKDCHHIGRLFAILRISHASSRNF